MPHATTADDDQAQRERDDVQIRQLFVNPTDTNLEYVLGEDPGRDTGEKADDAIDFADLADDDLAEDEDEQPGDSLDTEKIDSNAESFEALAGLAKEDDLPELTSGSGPENDAFDDLFGDTPSSPVEFGDAQTTARDAAQPSGISSSFDFEGGERFPGFSQTIPEIPFSIKDKSTTVSDQPLFRAATLTSKDAALSKEQALQEQLFAMSGVGTGGTDYPPAPPENQEELLASLWPKFENGTVPRFMDLLPPKKARFVGKTPLKIPKPVHPTKVSLELAPDQAKSFKLSTTSHKRSYEDYEQQGIIKIPSPPSTDVSRDYDVDMESDFENETIGGLTWQDLEILCEDWDIDTLPLPSSPDQLSKGNPGTGDQDDLFRDIEEGWATGAGQHPMKVTLNHQSVPTCTNSLQ